MEVGGGRIVGIAKGAGMIEPNMATMLAYVLTDLDLPREVRISLSLSLSLSVCSTFYERYLCLPAKCHTQLWR